MHLLQNIRYLLESLLAYSVIGILRFLGLRFGGNFASMVAKLVGSLNKVNRITFDNLRQAFPKQSEAEITALAKQVWANAGRTFGEYANLDKLRRYHKKYIAIKGSNTAKKTAAKGRGLILFSAHIGNWESMSMAIDIIGLDAVGIYRHANNPIMNRWMVKKRARSVIPEQYPKGAKGAKQLIKKLRSGGVICMLLDQKMNDGIEARFFGRKAMTPSAAASMARRYNVPLMLMTNKRLENGTFKVEFHDAFEAAKTNNIMRDIQNTTQKINDLLEVSIRAIPAQWLWMHNRWSGKR